MWDPFKLDENDVTNYLKILQYKNNLLNIKGLSFTFVRRFFWTQFCLLEDEKGFNILKECNYNVNEAVGKYQQYKESNDYDERKWNEEDNLAFEEGYKEFGKDFKKIQENMVFKTALFGIIFIYFWTIV